MADVQIENGFTKIASELIDAFNYVSTRLTGYEHAMLGVIIRKTYGFLDRRTGSSKKTDWISHSKFEELGNIPYKHVDRTRKLLLDKNMIIVEGRNYGIQKDWSLWKVPVKKGKYKGMFVKIVIPEEHKPKPKDKPKEDAKRRKEIKEVTEYFYDAYRNYIGSSYISKKPGDERTMISWLLEPYSIKDLKIGIDRFFTSEDQFVIDSAHTIAVFRSQIRKLISHYDYV